MTLFRGTFRALQTLALVGSFLLALTQTACEKKRGLRFTQGSGENLFELGQYNNKTFKVKTGEKRFKGQTSRADELLTLNGFDKINSLDAVAFEINDGLFAGIDISDFNFYGRENFEYTLKYSFSDYYVILSKVAAKADIPSQELTFAVDLGNGQYEVPLMGLPIGLFSVEKVKDERGKETRQLSTFEKAHIEAASHFKVKQGNIKYFEAPAKPDLFSADFFNANDEWFFTKTLVGRSITSESTLGSTQASLKIKFAKTNNSIIGVDLNIASEQEVLDPTKTITALEIPVQWVDFKTDSAGDSARLKENILGDKESSARFWKERKYALVDFNNADRLDKAFTLDNKLEKLEVSEDYISFTIYESSSGDTYKYSLAKSNRKIVGQTLFADDAKMFHIFTQRRTVIRGALQSQDPDIDKLIYSSRFYPENKEIVYHISKNSPTNPEFTEAVRDAIKAWDLAFQEANTGIHVRLADDRVELGDVRYNTIVLYGYEIDSGRLLGFGPSVQDTRTGETFSAATHIYLRSYREGLITSIRNFIRGELGLYEDKLVDQVGSFAGSDQYVTAGGLVNSPNPNLGSLARLNQFLNKNNMFAAELQSDLKSNIFGSKNVLDAVENFQSSVKPAETTKKADLVLNANGTRCDYGSFASVANSWKKIRDICVQPGKKLHSYLSTLKSLHAADSNVLNADDEEAAILECAQPLMKDLLTSTLIHEVGHNLGLGHNFAGSSDIDANHAKNADGTTAYPSSSVMDYPDRDFDLYSKAGPYDVAAIRFLYTRSVETKTKQFIQVPSNQSMFAAAKKQGQELKAYRMCTDYELSDDPTMENIPLYDPMCSRWDVGSTPLKYVKWAISQIHADLIQNGYRYNNKGFAGAIRSLSYLDHFKQIQEYFRFLVRSKAGVYFEKLTGDTSEAKKQSLEALMKSAPERDRILMQNYYDAVSEIYNFAHEVINLPSRTCLLEDADGKLVDQLEFAPLRQLIFASEQVTIQNCKEASVYSAKVFTDLKKTYADKVATLKFVDRGLELKGLELDLDPAAAANKLKQIHFATLTTDLDPRFSSGSFLLKAKVIETLTSRSSILQVAAEAGVGSTNFLDYPWFAEKLYSEAWSTLLDGADGANVDAKLLSGTLLQHYQDFVGLTPLYLNSLYSSGLQPRSESYGFAKDMQPKKESSLSVFEQGPGASADPIWYTVNPNNEVLYSDSGAAKELIKLFVQIGQFVPSYLSFVATHVPEEKPKTLASLTEASKTLDSEAKGEQRQFEIASKFLESNGLSNLQPAQKAVLKAAIKEAMAAAPAPTISTTGTQDSVDPNSAEAQIVMNALEKFTNSNDVLNRRVMKLYFADQNNFRALNTTLSILLGSF